MKAIRQRVRVQPGGRIEITDPALEPGTEAEVVVLLPEPAGDGADATPEAPPRQSPVNPRPGGLPLVDENGKPVFLPPSTPRPGRSLVDLIGLAPSERTAAEIDREIRDFRGDDEDSR